MHPLGSRRLGALLALLVLAAGAVAAYSAPAGDPQGPPTVVFREGDDAGPATPSVYVRAYRVEADGSSMSAVVAGVPEATLRVDSFLRIENIGARPQRVGLVAYGSDHPLVGAYTLELHDGRGAAAATLDLEQPTSRAALDIAPGQIWHARLTLTLESGAGSDNVALAPRLALAPE